MSTFKKEKAPLKPTRKARNELTEEQKQEIKEAFDLFDTDGVGTSLFTQDTSMQRNSRSP
jgi:Ca2+-binding EF-hand superfamily protein